MATHILRVGATLGAGAAFGLKQAVLAHSFSGQPPFFLLTGSTLQTHRICEQRMGGAFSGQRQNCAWDNWMKKYFDIIQSQEVLKTLKFSY